MDGRTGLGRFRDFAISNYQLMTKLIDLCREKTVEEILAVPDVKERVDLYFQQQPLFRDQIERCAKMHGNLVVLDVRGEEVVYAGNRFMVYALFPEANISMHVLWGFRRQNVVCAVGKSIFDRSSRTNIGKLMLEYGGGGHESAGTCQVGAARADAVIAELVERITADG
jgi:nanoRNase/pAp phosphatase (c-di-AMP/oligoRNAs hydrolase)